MSNLAKLDIAALDVSGKNYMTWALDAKMHLKANGLLEAIDIEKETSEEKKAKAMIFLRHHLHDNLKSEYITKEDPVDLWQSLKDRFDHQKFVILPKARHEWLNLRFMDYKSVGDYNSALFGITSRMMLCGEKITDYDMIEKTLQTFHPVNVSLQQQYRTKGYTKYSELMNVLLVAEQNNELVMMNYQTRPVGSAPFLEANAASSSRNNNWQGRGRGRGRGHGHGYGGRGGTERRLNNNSYNAGKADKNFKINKDTSPVTKPEENKCYRCGIKGHWSRTCRTPKHLVKLYKESQKEKEKNGETNFISEESEPSFDNTHMDLDDFLVEPKNVNE